MAKKPKRSPSKVKKNAVPEGFVSDVVGQMENKFGDGSALIPDSGTILCKVDHWVSTRNFLIDHAIAGGLPQPRPLIPFGRLTEIAGLNGVGKTTLMGHIMAETQAQGGIAAIADTEQALDLAYFEKLGVDLSRLIILQCDTVEDVFTKFISLIDIIREQQSDQLITIGWDSLGGTATKAELEADADAHFYAEAAKVVGKNLRRTVQKINKERIALVFNNHLYHKMGVQFGDPYQTYGGEKIKFASTLRIRLKKIGELKEGPEDNRKVIGHMVRVKIIKNKMAPVLRVVDVPCIGDYGFSLDYSVYHCGLKQKVIKGTTWKTWKSPSGDVKFQGWKGFREKVMVHPEYPELVTEVVSKNSQR